MLQNFLLASQLLEYLTLTFVINKDIDMDRDRYVDMSLQSITVMLQNFLLASQLLEYLTLTFVINKDVDIRGVASQITSN